MNVFFTINVCTYTSYTRPLDVLIAACNNRSLPFCSISAHDPLGTTRPLDVLIEACNDPCDHSCDIMH